MDDCLVATTENLYYYYSSYQPFASSIISIFSGFQLGALLLLIEKLQSKVDRQKVAFVMLSLDENFELAKNFTKKNKMQLPVYYPAEDLPAMFKTNGIPATFIFNEKGELIKANNGMDDYDTDEYVQLLKS